MRRAGYNIDALVPKGMAAPVLAGTRNNPSHLFVGSEALLGCLKKLN